MASIRSATRLASTMSMKKLGASQTHPFVRSPLLGSSSVSIRVSTTSVVSQYDKIRTEEHAKEIVDRLSCDERKLLHAALHTSLLGVVVEGQEEGERGMEREEISKEQAKALFLVNGLPFVAFGCLDNMIMIVAGEYIDQSLGAWLALSTMAAAALGNLISDVAGVGLAHYVEIAVGRVGIKHPVLTGKQLESGKARFMTNSGRAIGLSIGCLIGMFPLLFYDDDKKEQKDPATK